jgi:deazaflavin-dependent oxidoreductase (nitroreductase family)
MTNRQPSKTTGAASGTRDMRQSRFQTKYWRLGNAIVSVLARLGIGPIAILTVTGRKSGQRHNLPVVPIDHEHRRWLVAPYGPVAWVHNVRANPVVALRYGRQVEAFTAREVEAERAAPVLKRYLEVATRARAQFEVSADSPVDSFVAEASTHPVFVLEPR